MIFFNNQVIVDCNLHVLFLSLMMECEDTSAWDNFGIRLEENEVAIVCLVDPQSGERKKKSKRSRFDYASPPPNPTFLEARITRIDSIPVTCTHLSIRRLNSIVFTLPLPSPLLAYNPTCSLGSPCHSLEFGLTLF